MTSRVCATTSRGRRLKDPATVATINQPDELGANALTLAASLNVPKPEIIKALLKAGADVNAKLGEEWSEKDTSALYRAVEGESLECVELIVAAGADLGGNQIYGAFVLNRRVDLHAIDATPARWRGGAGSSPLDGDSTAPRHPTHWLISTQVETRPSSDPRRRPHRNEA